MALAVARARTQERQPGLQAVADQRVRSQERRTLLRPRLQGGSRSENPRSRSRLQTLSLDSPSLMP